MALLDATLAVIEPADEEYREQATARLQSLAMPPWALSQLLDLGVDLAGITRSIRPSVERRLAVVMCGDHGVVAEGVTAYPQEVTQAILLTAVHGGAGINVLARRNNCDLLVVDMGVAGDTSHIVADNFLSRLVAHGTQSILAGPAMTPEQALQAIETGINIASIAGQEYDVLVTGEMGIGNTTPATAILCALTKSKPKAVTGRGAGVDDKGLKTKIKVIEKAIKVNKPKPDDGLDVLAKLGGFEIGGLVGVILGAAAMRKPVVVDGFISTSAGLIAQAICPAAADYMIAGHASAEPGHQVMLEKLGKTALLDLGLRLGEGTGAVLALNLLDAAVGVLSEMYTLNEALGLKPPQQV